MARSRFRPTHATIWRFQTPRPSYRAQQDDDATMCRRSTILAKACLIRNVPLGFSTSRFLKSSYISFWKRAKQKAPMCAAYTITDDEHLRFQELKFQLTVQQQRWLSKRLRGATSSSKNLSSSTSQSAGDARDPPSLLQRLFRDNDAQNFFFFCPISRIARRGRARRPRRDRTHPRPRRATRAEVAFARTRRTQRGDVRVGEKRSFLFIILRASPILV